MNTIIIKDNDDLSLAAQILVQGGLVAVPTDTIYGLACNGLDAAAVAKIYEVKGRPAIKPLILLVAGLNTIETVCEDIPDAARRLAEAFWPGPLTIVMPRCPVVPDIVTAGGDTVGVRCPGHPKTLELLRIAGVPAAAPSANPSGMPSPKSFDEVLNYFDGKIDCIVDGGICALGVESTIVSLANKPFEILRQGALPEEEIRRVLG